VWGEALKWGEGFLLYCRAVSSVFLGRSSAGLEQLYLLCVSLWCLQSLRIVGTPLIGGVRPVEQLMEHHDYADFPRVLRSFLFHQQIWVCVNKKERVVLFWMTTVRISRYLIPIVRRCYLFPNLYDTQTPTPFPPIPCPPIRKL